MSAAALLSSLAGVDDAPPDVTMTITQELTERLATDLTAISSQLEKIELGQAQTSKQKSKSNPKVRVSVTTKTTDEKPCALLTVERVADGQQLRVNFLEHMISTRPQQDYVEIAATCTAAHVISEMMKDNDSVKTGGEFLPDLRRFLNSLSHSKP
jgi:hypothetical protein